MSKWRQVELFKVTALHPIFGSDQSQLHKRTTLFTHVRERWEVTGVVWGIMCRQGGKGRRKVSRCEFEFRESIRSLWKRTSLNAETLFQCLDNSSATTVFGCKHTCYARPVTSQVPRQRTFGALMEFTSSLNALPCFFLSPHTSYQPTYLASLFQLAPHPKA